MNATTKTTTEPISTKHSQPDAVLITRAIRDADRRMRDRFAFLCFQSAIGTGFVALGYGMAATSTWLYVSDVLPIWICILVNAIAFALLREIEHDLIHNLYFTGKRAVQNFVLFLIWPALGNVPSPLYRRKMHLLHHRSSGRVEDIEERLIGNGTGFGPMRWLTMVDTGISMVFRRRELEQIPGFRQTELFKHLVPVVFVYYVFWVSFLAYHAITWGAFYAGFNIAMPWWIESIHPLIDVVAVVWVLPNVIRQACLQVLSSVMHYFGDVQSVVEQTQVLSKWYWTPLQWISINFGKSHAIHHFVANQPFYLREMVRREAHAAMRKHGVRFDDLGTFRRANRWGHNLSALEAPASSKLQSSQNTRPTRPEVASKVVGAGVVRLELKGKIDAAAAAEFEVHLLESLKQGKKRLAIDFSQVEQISNSALRVLLNTAKRLVSANGKMVLFSLNDQIKQVFHLSGFSLIFSVHSSEEEAFRGLETAAFITKF